MGGWAQVICNLTIYKNDLSLQRFWYPLGRGDPGVNPPCIPGDNCTMSVSSSLPRLLLILQNRAWAHLLLSNYPKTQSTMISASHESLQAYCLHPGKHILYCHVTSPILPFIILNRLQLILYKQGNAFIFVQPLLLNRTSQFFHPHFFMISHAYSRVGWLD